MNNRKQVLLLFRLSALVILATICQKSGLCGGISQPGLLQLPDFKLESRVRVLTPGKAQFDKDLELTEYYSNVQCRARLDIHTGHTISGSKDVNSRGIIYFYRSQSSKDYLRLDAIPMVYSKKCQLVEPSVFTKDLFGQESSLESKSLHNQWLEERPDVPHYVIGLARLLLIVESNKDKLEPTNNNKLIRNQKAKKYTLKDRIMSNGVDKMTELIVYYADTNDLQSGMNLPIRIWVISQDYGEIVVDYTFDGSIWPGPSDPINENNNFFSFPIGLGCSEDLQKAVQPSVEQTPDVFSFRFEIESLSDDTPITSYFVAHDGYAHATRLDKVNQMDQDGRMEAGDYSATISDIQLNRCFNIRQPIREMEGDRDSPSKDKQCAASMLVPDDPASFYHELTLPFVEMVEMGTHKVRGIEARVFEHVTHQLPALFFPKMWYRDPINLKYDYVDDTKTPDSSWVVVYFFAPMAAGTNSRHQQFGQLLRVDVLKLKTVAFRIEVYDFKWSLQMAPNGDSQDELFALRDRCSQVLTATGQTQDRYANLELEVEYNEIGHLIQAKEAEQLIKGPSVRRQEFTRALVMSRALGATNLYDMESRMKPIGSDSLLLKFKAKLIDLKQQPVFEAVYMGPGTIIESETPSRATNVDECFWDAVHEMRQSSSEVLFSFCFQTCVIDSNAEFRKNPETSALEYVASTVFNLSKLQQRKLYITCSVMSVQQVVPGEFVKQDGGNKKDNRQLWKSVFSSLNQGRLFLPLVNPSYGNSVASLSLRIKLIEINNNRWSESVGLQVEDAKLDWDDADETLIGLGLARGSWSEQVDPPPLNLPTTLRDLEDLEDADVAPMSFELCQAKCMADMNCRSFSLCAVKSSKDLVCRKSELEFRRPELLKRIASLANPLKQTNKKGRIQLNVEHFEDPESLDDGSQAKQVELEVDKRCRLYNKSALQMFKFTRTSGSLKVRNVNLVGVDSEEQCAERCVRINLNFFKRAAKVRVKSLLNKDKKQQDELLREVLLHQETDLGTWCKGFNYINLATASLSDELKVSLGSSKTKKNGLCRVRRDSVVSKLNHQPQASTTQEGEQRKLLRIKSDKYDLIYSNLYEKRPGYRMRPRWPSGLSDEHGEIPLDKLVEKMPTHNKQIVLKKGSVDDCARACFLQTTGMKPPCKSFGVYRGPAQDKSLKDSEDAYCILNSMTLDEALKSGEQKELIIKLGNVSERVTMHYDPKSAYNMDNLVMVGLLLQEKNSLVGSIRYFQFGSIGLLILIALSLATGLWLGLSQGQRYLDSAEGRRESVSSPSRSFLTSLVGSSEVTHQRFEPEIDLSDIRDV